MARIFLFIFLALAIGIPESTYAELRAIPTLTGPVIDEAGLLNATEASNLEKVISNNTSHSQIQIWIIKSLENEPIENLSIRAVETWKLGSAQRDNGVLILVSPSDRKMRIEVGQGLEGAIPDAFAARIVRNIIGPAFRERAYYRGLFLAVSEISEISRREFESPGQTIAAPVSGFEKLLGMFFIPLLFIIMLLVNVFRVRNRLAGGNIYGARGSGGFSGGGSSGSW